MNRRDMLMGGIAGGIAAGANLTVGSAFAAPDENPFPPKRIVFADPERYSPLSYLGRVHDSLTPQLTFTAATRTELDTWRVALRPRLWELLGEQHIPGRRTPVATMLESVQKDGYVSHKYEVETVPGRWMPVYVLVPDGVTAPYRTVLCLHGHGNGARDIIGEPVNEEARTLIGILNTDYAVQAVRRGWCAVAPELFGFGERVDLVEDARPGFDGGCEKPFLNAVEVGKTLIGIRAKDICALIDALAANDIFNTSELACVGLSGGGMMTMYTAALDDRIKRVCIAGYLTEMKDSILGIRHCSCNYVPGLAAVADFPDIAAMIAPRPLIVQAGRRDAIFPIESTRRAFARVRRAYEVAGAADRIVLDEHDGFHEFWSTSLDRLLA